MSGRVKGSTLVAGSSAASSALKYMPHGDAAWKHMHTCSQGAASGPEPTLFPPSKFFDKLWEMQVHSSPSPPGATVMVVCSCRVHVTCMFSQLNQPRAFKMAIQWCWVIPCSFLHWTMEDIYRGDEREEEVCLSLNSYYFPLPSTIADTFVSLPAILCRFKIFSHSPFKNTYLFYKRTSVHILKYPLLDNNITRFL